MFSHRYEIRYGDYLDLHSVRPAALLDMVQDVSSRHSAACGYDMRSLYASGLCWILQGMKLRLLAPADNQKPIDAFTAVAQMKGITSERGCILRQEGVTVAKTVANWVLFDIAAQKLARFPDGMAEAYGLHDFQDDFFRYHKPAPAAETQPLYSLPVGRREIDTNRHLNNQKGAELLMEALPEGFSFREMSVYYKRSAYEGDILTLSRAEIDGGWYAALHGADGGLCLAARFTAE